jgi:hypothetical protein
MYDNSTKERKGKEVNWCKAAVIYQMLVNAKLKETVKSEDAYLL